MSSREPSGILFFASPAELRSWFRKNHGAATELWVGFFKKGSGEPSITWPESVDEALGVGWIDGIRKNLDADRYVIRFTPRKSGSVWSAINIARVSALEAEGRMRPAGRKAFEARKENRSGIYSYEQREARLPTLYERRLRKNPPAWRFFHAQPPSYRKAACWWVVSAKKEETREKRLSRLIDLSEKGRRIPQFTRPTPGKSR
jgi:uncharacterized protein YdeI (YjbR/CyaY-like superfamily)